MPTVMIGGVMKNYAKGTLYETIANEYQEKFGGRIALVSINGKMTELSKRLEKDGVLQFITTADSSGHNAYVRTALMMLVKAVGNLLRSSDKKIRVRVEFALNNAYYCTVHGGINVSPQFAKRVEEEMRRISDSRIPITKKVYPRDDAIELFHRQGMTDKEKLFHFRRSSTINVYNLEGFYDYFYGYMFPNTGYVKIFTVNEFEGGLLLNLPSMENPELLEPVEKRESLFEQLMLSTEWGKLIGISTVGDLNMKVCDGGLNDMILVQEALQERRIGEIAQKIHERKGVKFILVAGPSSSGKTTFSHRLSIQLRSFGIHPHIISMDDYFLNREHTPIDSSGNYNFDVLEALDLELFNDDMNDLLKGETVEIPSFDFKLGKKVYKGRYLKLEKDDVLIIEGIHGLNPKATEDLPKENKFKIYISAMTSMNIDEHNWVPSRDLRLLRRLVRDARTRGHSAQDTLNGWRNVIQAEDEFILPFQDGADAVFNSMLVYELSVMKQFAEPLLYNVGKNEPEYYEAKRLLKFLEYFVGVDTAAVPTNSLCREFVGGGCFNL